jgi:Tfp pilus assembly protein PilZ
VTFEGVTLDICPGGLFVISAQVVPPNISLHLEVLLDDGSVMMCRGKVAWVNLGQLDHYPPGFGVEFLDPPGGAQLMLLHNLSNYKGSSDRP